MLVSYVLFEEQDNTFIIKTVEKDFFIKLCEEHNFSFLGKDVEFYSDKKANDLIPHDFKTDGLFTCLFGDKCVLVKTNENNKVSLFKQKYNNNIDTIYLFKKDNCFVKYYETKKCVKFIIDQ
jgi:hypothetical protein